MPKVKQAEEPKPKKRRGYDKAGVKPAPDPYQGLHDEVERKFREWQRRRGFAEED